MARDTSIDTQEKFAARSGLGQSTISRLLLCEASPNVDALILLGKAMKCLPFELLLDEESTRRSLIERLLDRPGAPDPSIAPPRPKITAPRRKKKH